MGQAAAQGEAYWRVHVEAWRSSGQSRGEYCALHGLSRKTFGWWAWRLDRQERPAPAGTAAPFLPGGGAEGPERGAGGGGAGGGGRASRTPRPVGGGGGGGGGG